MPNNKGKYLTPYLTPYVSGIYDVDNDIEAIGNFMARTLKLPPSVQGIFRNFSTAEFIEENLGQMFGLTIDQKASLVRIIRGILLADEFLGDFPSLISSRLGVEMNTANQIAQKIVNELFAPAMEDIKNMQRGKFRDRTAQTRSSQTQQPPPNVSTEGNVINLRHK